MNSNFIQQGIVKVREFQKAFNLTNNYQLTDVSVDEIELRYSLFVEEFKEFEDGYKHYLAGLEYFVDKSGDRVHAFTYMCDAICDMLYILFGTSITHGFNDANFNFEKKFLILSADENILSLISNLSRESIIYRFDEKSRLEVVEFSIYRVLQIAIELNVLDALDEMFTEVHKSNLSKLDDEGNPLINGNNWVLDVNKPLGKVLKSKNFFEPNLYGILVKRKKFNN